MGLSPLDFESMTPAEFIYAQMGHIEKMRQQELMLLRVQRWGSYVSLMPYMNNDVSMCELLPIPGDDEFDSSKITKKSKKKKLSTSQRRKKVNRFLDEIGYGKSKVGAVNN